MSSNLDLVRSIHADWGRGDFTRADWADPEIELVVAVGPDAGVYRGVAAIAKPWVDFLSTWEDYRYVAEEYREIDDERILVPGHAEGRAKRSGIDAEQARARGANLFQIRNGKVIRVVMCGEHDRAFADLGLTPKGDAP